MTTIRLTMAQALVKYLAALRVVGWDKKEAGWIQTEAMRKPSIVKTIKVYYTKNNLVSI